MESNECLIFILVYYLVGYTLMFIFLRDKRIKRDYTTFERCWGMCTVLFVATICRSNVTMYNSSIPK